jgi:hypothetical protein
MRLQLCIGCVDASKFSGDISWIPVVRRSYWTVEMNAFVVNEMSAGVTNLFAVNVSHIAVHPIMNGASEGHRHWNDLCVPARTDS